MKVSVIFGFYFENILMLKKQAMGAYETASSIFRNPFTNSYKIYPNYAENFAKISAELLWYPNSTIKN